MAAESPPALDPFAFWNGRRVFVTGTTGFKGCWLALLLGELGAEVVGYSLAPPSDPSLFELLSSPRGFRQIDGDVCDGAALRQALAEVQPSVVLHLAAQSLVRTGHDQPIETWQTNLMGSVQLLETLRHSPSVQSCVVVTTDKVYGDPEGAPLVEGDRLGGQGPYSASKAAAELAAEAARRTTAAGSGPRIATARAGNTLGGGDWAAHRLVPDCVRAAGAGQALVLRQPDSVRPWQHVLDVLWGYLQLAEALTLDAERYGRAWNFGPDPSDEECVRTLASRVMAGLGRGTVEIDPDPAGPSETAVLRLDSSRARSELGWQPLLNGADCIEWTVRWYRGWLDGDAPDRLCRQDVDQYLALRRRPVA